LEEFDRRSDKCEIVSRRRNWKMAVAGEMDDQDISFVIDFGEAGGN